MFAGAYFGKRYFPASYFAPTASQVLWLVATLGGAADVTGLLSAYIAVQPRPPIQSGGGGGGGRTTPMGYDVWEPRSRRKTPRRHGAALAKDEEIVQTMGALVKDEEIVQIIAAFLDLVER